jgi:geranylgeranyl diphosphate synthase type I
MQDDILGIWGDPAVTGKLSGDDLVCAKDPPHPSGVGAFDAFQALGVRGSEPDGLAAMRRELEDCGALAATQMAAADHTGRALRSLAEATPTEPAASLIGSLSRQMLGRQS